MAEHCHSLVDISYLILHSVLVLLICTCLQDYLCSTPIFYSPIPTTPLHHPHAMSNNYLMENSSIEILSFLRREHGLSLRNVRKWVGLGGGNASEQCLLWSHYFNNTYPLHGKNVGGPWSCNRVQMVRSDLMSENTQVTHVQTICNSCSCK